jgi:hypothetical protein
MTVETDKSRRQFLGDGSKTKFPVDFRIYAEAEARVYVGETLQTLNVDYTISNINTALESFDVDFVTAPEANAVVTISRSLARVQNTDYVEGDDFPADAHEDALDRVVMIVQELDDKVSRASVYPETEAIAFDPTLPSKEDRASKFAAWDADGNPIAAEGSAGTPASAFMATLLDDTTAAAARTTLGFPNTADPVTTTATQTLTNKTLTSPTVTNPTITGDVSGASNLVRVLDRDVAGTTVDDTTTPTTIYTFNIPADTFGTDRVVRFAILGTVANGVGIQSTAKVEVKLGSTSIFDTTFTIQDNNDPGEFDTPVYVTGEISAQGATDSQIGVARGFTTGSNSADIAESALSWKALTEDSTAAITFTVVVTLGNTGNLTWTTRSVVLELL